MVMIYELQTVKNRRFDRNLRRTNNQKLTCQGTFVRLSFYVLGVFCLKHLRGG
jgi:hypothetical protein